MLSEKRRLSPVFVLCHSCQRSEGASHAVGPACQLCSSPFVSSSAAWQMPRLQDTEKQHSYGVLPAWTWDQSTCLQGMKSLLTSTLWTVSVKASIQRALTSAWTNSAWLQYLVSAFWVLGFFCSHFIGWCSPAAWGRADWPAYGMWLCASFVDRWQCSGLGLKWLDLLREM